MELRQVAKNSKAFQSLLNVYEHRDEKLKELKAQNKKLIGVVGDEVPDELLIAAGFVPVKLCGKIGGSTKYASENLEDYVFVDQEFATMYDRILDGTYKEVVDRIVISHPKSWNYRLFLSVREHKRQQPDAAVPEIYFLDFEGGTNLLDQERNKAIYAKFGKEIEAWAGKALKEEEISKGIKICNENRDAIAAFDSLRKGIPAKVTGTEAMVVIGAAMFMEREEHTKLVNELVAEAANWPEVNSPRVYFSGSDQYNTSLYSQVEAKGVNIVGEDHNWGVRFYIQNVVEDKDLFGALVNRYLFRLPKEKGTVASRVVALQNGVTESNAQGVLFYFTQADGYCCWDYPSERDMLEQKGIPHALLGRQKVPEKYPEKVDEAVLQLKSSIEGGK